MTHHSKIILRHRLTGNIYEHVHDSTFRNVVNGKTKDCTKEEAQLLIINGTLTNFANENPNFLKLIKAGMLSVEL